MGSFETDYQYPPVPEFYSGKSVFITGGTGFLGKVFIEKLLYACPEIDSIYVLIRDKKNVVVEKRLMQLIGNDLFNRIKESRPEAINKIIPIVGDITATNLGIRHEDEQVLIEKVSIVYHSAATLKFNEPLSTALNNNVEGTIKVLNLCRRMKNIEAFVHISTAYSNTDRTTVDEVIYPPPAKLEDVYRFLELHGDDEEQTAILLNGRPNTYAFTKALAEAYVAENHYNIPTIIVRPSIVTAMKTGPITGWLENWVGASGLISAVSNGLVRVIIGHDNNTIDLIPVDYVSNLIIVAATRCIRNQLYVYNCCTSYSNPITLRKLFRFIIKPDPTPSYYDALQYLVIVFTRCKWIYYIIIFIFETIPAYVIDICLRFSGRRPRYVKLQQQLLLLRQVLEYFTARTWDLRSERTQALSASLSQADRQLFPFDPRDIVWHEYISTYCTGIDRFLIKQTPDKKT